MDNGGRTIAELRFWQSRPLIEKVFKAQETIKNFVSEFQKYTLHNFYTGQERTVICGQDDIHSKITKDEDIIDWTPAVYISFSGGKDSTVLLHIARIIRRKAMKWEKLSNKEWRAVGAKGSFFIEKSGRLYWSRYTSTSGLKTFRMPPKQKVSDAKAMCEENQYWEEEEKC